MDNVIVYLYGNEKTQRPVWLLQEGFAMDEGERLKEVDSKGKIWDSLLKLLKKRLNSKVNFVCLVEKESGHTVNSLYELHKLGQLRLIQQQEIFLACLTDKQLKKGNYTQAPENYFTEQTDKIEISTGAAVKVIAMKSDFEEEAEAQLRNVPMTHKDVLFAIGMPDLHPGRGYPIGSSIITSSIVYPPLIGSDIG